MRSLILIAILFALLQVQAQQLVPNGDLETFTLCPDYVSQIERATGWSRPTEGTSDYFNACLSVPFSLSVPGNQFGEELARSGNGYAGFYCFYGNSAEEVPGETDREYVMHALSAPMIPGQIYHVEFHVSLADVSKYAVQHIGALLSVEAPHRDDELPIASQPQIVSNGTTWLDQKEGWMKISACFVADSAYTFITIGNFRNGGSTEYVEVPTQFQQTYFSYYYIDDVSVMPIEKPVLGADIESCSGVIISVEEPIEGVIYTWSNGGVGTSTEVDTSGWYWVMAELNGCILSDSINVTILSPIVLYAEAITHDFCAEPMLSIQPSDLPPGATVVWNNGSMNASLIIDHPGTYTYTITAPLHCPATASITVHDSCEHPVFIPNAFTPNGDGINDIFLPVFDQWSMRLTYTIFDRWGSPIFKSDGEAWSGEEHPIGVYQLLYQTEQLFTKVRSTGSAHVTLIR